MNVDTLIDYSVSDGIATLTLNNPPLNLVTLEMVRQLIELCDHIRDDDSVRVVVLTGSGDRAFCAGSNIHEFVEVLDDVVKKKLAKENEAFKALEDLPKPVIAALNGVTLGGGAELAMVCDIRVLDANALMGFPEINLGVFPGSGGVFRLPRLVGSGAALELLYTGESIDAERAHQIGLVNMVAEHGKSLEVALDFARRIAEKPQLAMKLIRSGVRESFTQTIDQAILKTLTDSDTVFKGPDISEGVEAFFQKRSPSFRRASLSDELGYREHGDNR